MSGFRESCKPRYGRRGNWPVQNMHVVNGHCTRSNNTNYNYKSNAHDNNKTIITLCNTNSRAVLAKSLCGFIQGRVSSEGRLLVYSLNVPQDAFIGRLGTTGMAAEKKKTEVCFCTCMMEYQVCACIYL